MYDLIVIGAGVGGYTAALRAAKEGKKVALIDKADLGGTCLNRGCIPTKYLIHAGKQYHACMDAIIKQEYCGEISVNYEKILNDMKQKILKLTNGIQALLVSKNVDFIRGNAYLKKGKIVVIDSEKELRADNIFIATGSEPALPNIPGIELKQVYDTDNIFQKMKKLPASLLIIGAGVVGMEMAFLFNNLGVKVSVIECRNHLLGSMDLDVENYLRRSLQKSGIKYYLNSYVEEIAEDDGLQVMIKLPEETVIWPEEAVLIATGRKSVCRNLNLEEVGIKTDKEAILVDEDYQTNVSGIYAIGDVNGRNMLAYAATAQSLIAVGSMLKNQIIKDEAIIPQCIFTEPEIGVVGLTEEQAKENNRQIVIGKFLMTANGRSVVEGNEGFIKIIADKETGIVLGGACVCHLATELISQLTIAIKNQMTIEQLRQVVFPHPTYTEAVGEAAEMAFKTSVYMM